VDNTDGCERKVSGRIVDNTASSRRAAVRMSGTQNRLTVTDAQGIITSIMSKPTASTRWCRRALTQLQSVATALVSWAAYGAAFNATSTGGSLSPLDASEYFVRQQYVDSLNRNPMNPALTSG